MTEANTCQLNLKLNQGQCYIYTLSSSIIGLEAAATLIQNIFCIIVTKYNLHSNAWV